MSKKWIKYGGVTLIITYTVQLSVCAYNVFKYNESYNVGSVNISIEYPCEWLHFVPVIGFVGSAFDAFMDSFSYKMLNLRCNNGWRYSVVSEDIHKSDWEHSYIERDEDWIILKCERDGRTLIKIPRRGYIMP